MAERFDAVVVGSGFGGGVAACRLAEQGWRVCVLERGREFADFPAPGHIRDAPRMLWHRWLNPDGMLDLRSFRDLWVVCAAGVGGGSLAYANVLMPAKEDVFFDGWPADITGQALAPYYDRVARMLEPLPIDDPVPRKVEAFADLAQLAGLSFERAPIAVYRGPGRMLNGRWQSGCENNALCDVGCPMHAKNSIDLTYLAVAARHDAEIRARREATELSREDGVWRVTFRELGRRIPIATTGQVEAPVVVLAAGSLGSTRLLLNSARHLDRLSPALGRRFGGNGDALAVAFDPRHRALRDPGTPHAPVITSVMDLWDRQRFFVEDGGMPRGLIGLLDLVYALGRLRSLKLPLVLMKRLATYLGLSDVSLTQRSASRGRLEAQLNRFKGHDIENALVFLMMGDEKPNMRMTRTRLGRLDIRQEYPSWWNDRLFDGMKAQAEALARAAEAEDKWLPIGKFGPLGKPITVHPLGGCPMAESPAEGVVDSYGAVHGYREQGLYVLDGSILPTAAGINPAMTIAALAERGAERLADAGPPGG